jgi:hypothetical protein
MLASAPDAVVPVDQPLKRAEAEDLICRRAGDEIGNCMITGGLLQTTAGLFPRQPPDHSEMHFPAVPIAARKPQRVGVDEFRLGVVPRRRRWPLVKEIGLGTLRLACFR